MKWRPAMVARVASLVTRGKRGDEEEEEREGAKQLS